MMSVAKNTSPLLCWDIYMDSYQRLMRKGEDLQELKNLSKKQNWNASTWNLEEQLLRKEKVVLVTDTAQIIQFASSNLVEMNGYEPKEVRGKSPKIFQGPLTGTKERLLIREAVQQQRPFKTVVINYRKDGSLYHCHVEEYPVWNREGKLVNFIAFEKIA
jgi:PAS domain S-box-containing protein